jgi:hypothetical protein
LIDENYPRNPLAMRLLSEALDGGNPYALYIAAGLVHSKDHPLAPPGVKASVKYLSDTGSPAGPPTDNNAVSSAVEFILKFGTDKDSAILVQCLRKAKDEDLRRYAAIWHAYKYRYRQIPGIYAVLIDDRRPICKWARYCDEAVWAIEHAGGVQFTQKYDRDEHGHFVQTEEERDKGVEKAKAWMDQHFSQSPKP